MNQYHLSIITPEGKVFDDAVEALVAPGVDGFFGILKDHTPLVAQLKSGVLKLTQDSSEKFFTVTSGMLEFDQKNNCLILADQAVPANTAEEAKIRLSEIY